MEAVSTGFDSSALRSPLDPAVRAILEEPAVMAILEDTPASVATTATARAQESSSDDVSPGQANPSQVDVLASDDSGPARLAVQASQEPCSSGVIQMASQLVPLHTVGNRVPACLDCNMPCGPTKNGFRLRSKAKSGYHCGKCNYVGVYMNRNLGEWPTGEFNGFSTGGGVNALQLKYADTAACNHVERWKSSNHGDFPPMGYWAAIGYKEDLILKHAGLPTSMNLTKWSEDNTRCT